MQNKEQLIRKLFSGTCTREELEQLLQFVKEDPSEVGPEAMTELFEQLELAPRIDPGISERIFDLIEERKEDSHSIQEPRQKSVVRRQLYVRMSRVAAVVVLLIVGTWAIIEWWGEQRIQQQTAYNEIKEFVLPDGSQVILNGNSTLSYPRHWREGADREVILEGEAYFKVEKKPVTQAKFQVVTKDLTVEVLGTSFNVNTRRSETSVFLEEGKVKVALGHKTDEVVNLKPGEIMQYSALHKKLMAPKKIAKELETNWRTGNMEFRETPLQEILDEIAQANRLEFVIIDRGLAEEKFTLALPIEDMEAMMSILSRTIGVSLHKKGEVYIIDRSTEE